MLQQFTAPYFRQDKGDVISVRTVTQTDNDLVRGNDANESVQVSNGIRFVEERNGHLFIQLDGDRDRITVLNADRSIVDSFVFTDDLFAV